METTLTALETKILAAVQYGMPLSQTPYEDLAGQIGIPVEELLAVLRTWRDEKKIRRMGAIVNHFQLGRGIGGMVVWNVPEARIDEVGQKLAAFGRVSHAYLRPSSEQWPYNMYTMVHASDEGELESTIEKMSQESGISDFRVLKTVRELKKVPPTYVIKP